MSNKKDKKKEIIVNIITIFSVILVLIIFGFTVYLILKKEAGKEKNNMATMTDAINMNLLGLECITTEATTEELTTEVIVIVEEPTTEVTTEEITTEATTEELVEDNTNECEETYICDDTYDSCYSSDEYNGYEEESYSEEPDDCYDEQSEEEYVDPNGEEPSEQYGHEGMRYYGTMDTTAYEWTDETCADGRYPELGYTAACNDPALWNHWVYIEGVGERYIHDHGDPEVMGNTTVDIYMGDVDTCYQYGRQTCDIYIID